MQGGTMTIHTIVPLAAPAVATVMDTATAAFWLTAGALGTAYFYHCGRRGVSPLHPIRDVVARFRPSKPEPKAQDQDDKPPMRPRVGL
jgi:hypothetical protein